MNEYGVFGSLMGFLSLLLVLSQGIRYCAINYVAMMNEQTRAQFIKGFTKRVTGFALAIFLGIMLLSPWILDFLQISDPYLLVFMAATAVLELIGAIFLGMMGGLQKFTMLGVISIAASIFKLIFGLGLVLMGFGVVGALGAVTAASLIMLIIMLIMFYPRGSNGKYEDGYHEVVRYFLTSFLVAVIFAAPGNADIVIVKNMFTDVDAGLYTAISVLGKILIFLPTGIAGAMFPKVAAMSKGSKEPLKILKKTLQFSISITVAGAATFIVLPNFILNLVYGSEFDQGAYLLPWYGLMVVFFSISLIIANFSLARKQFLFVRVFTILTLLEFTMVYLFSTSLLVLIQIMLVMNVITAIVGILIANGEDVKTRLKRYSD